MMGFASLLWRKDSRLAKETEKFNAKDEYFLRNGAILLEKQISSYNGKAREPLRIFSAKDIERATNNYDTHLILGRPYTTVYKGTLDDRTVSIKVPLGFDPTDEVINFFLNQVTTKLQISHKNVAKLIGCCLETLVPILVHEFIPNGSLASCLHGTGGVAPRWIAWMDRLSIATDIAYALSYMHSATSKPIIHRDVKSTSIFLDENFTAKLSNFGLSVSISPDETFRRWPVEGTVGYLDPEYLETNQVTEKCDVYSFGAVLVELLTGKRPSEVIERDIRLVGYFVSSMKENHLLQVVDGRILQEGSMVQIQAFAVIALRCVEKKGEKRPNMKEVVQELRRIRDVS